MLKPFLRKVTAGLDLTRREAASAMEHIMRGEADDAQIAALAVGLRMKGETPEEIVGCAAAIRRRAERVTPGRRTARRLVDTCGTGGDSLGTINVSTLAAFVVAAAGVPVAKHGNRSVSSRCGSADLLEALNVPIDLEAGKVEECLEATGLAFLYAPRFHPALRHAARARRAVGVRTIFNLLGPLCNPAGARRQVLGVFDRGYLRIMAEVLRSLGSQRVMLVHGHDGMDELTVTGPTAVAELKGGRIRMRSLTPESAGLSRWRSSALCGGDARRNADRALGVLEGRQGAARDLTLFNAGAALLVAEAAPTLRDAVRLAGESVDSGAAMEKLVQFRRFCKAAAGAGNGRRDALGKRA